jgi:hypothetical protein
MMPNRELTQMGYRRFPTAAAIHLTDESHTPAAMSSEPPAASTVLYLQSALTHLSDC